MFFFEHAQLPRPIKKISQCSERMCSFGMSSSDSRTTSSTTSRHARLPGPVFKHRDVLMRLRVVQRCAMQVVNSALLHSHWPIPQSRGGTRQLDCQQLLRHRCTELHNQHPEQIFEHTVGSSSSVPLSLQRWRSLEFTLTSQSVAPRPAGL